MRSIALHRWPDLVGLPHVELGRDRSGVDCWGLIRLGFDELAGIELPSYAGFYVSTSERAEIAALIEDAEASPDWSMVEPDALQPLDVAVFRRGRLESHLGLVVDPARTLMLHAASGHGSRAESFATGYWMPRLTGFWRHRELCS